jgi:magnesium transporter
MGDINDSTPFVWQRGEPGQLRDQNRILIDRITKMIKNNESKLLVDCLSEWHPADAVELLVNLPLKRARKLHGWLPEGPAAKAIAVINPRLRMVLLEESTIARMVKIVNKLSTVDAVSFLAELPQSILERLLPKLKKSEELMQRLAYQKDSAGSIMRKRFVAVPPDWTVEKATYEIRDHATDVESMYALYVIDSNQKLIGMLNLYDLLLQSADARIGDVMRKVVVQVSPLTDQEDVVHLAERYDLVTIPVVDEAEQLIGDITVDELRDVIRLEAEEDMMIMSGISANASPEDSILRMVQGRFVWLVIGMVGSVLGALIIMQFEKTLEEAAILAAFIPLVAATAGNAGIQSSAVAVQGLAYGSVWNGSIIRRFGKELSVAILNGLGIALLVGLFIFAVTIVSPVSLEHPFQLAMTIGTALMAVITLATLMGAAMPLVLDRFGIDPAVSTGPFITVTNDVVGISVYFVTATLIYLNAGPP